MIFKGPGGFGRVLNIVMCMVMCVVLSVIILSTMQGVPGNETLPIFTLLGFGVSFLMSFCVGYVVGDLFPALSWGAQALRRFPYRKQDSRPCGEQLRARLHPHHVGERLMRLDDECSVSGFGRVRGDMDDGVPAAAGRRLPCHSGNPALGDEARLRDKRVRSERAFPAEAGGRRRGGRAVLRTARLRTPLRATRWEML